MKWLLLNLFLFHIISCSPRGDGGKSPRRIAKEALVLYYIADNRTGALDNKVFMEPDEALAAGYQMVAEPTKHIDADTIATLAQGGKKVILVGYSNGVTTGFREALEDCAIADNLTGVLMLKGRTNAALTLGGITCAGRSDFAGLYYYNPKDVLGYFEGGEEVFRKTIENRFGSQNSSHMTGDDGHFEKVPYERILDELRRLLAK